MWEIRHEPVSYGMGCTGYAIQVVIDGTPHTLAHQDHVTGDIESRPIDRTYVELTLKNRRPFVPEFPPHVLLVAAAPDLLAALKGLVPADFDEHPQDFMEDWHTARAAIAKAEGK